jgi:DNA invertase Pin-like site-specific DNA recombinase
MLSEVRQRHIDLILVWALDRFSREGMTNTLSYIKQLRQYKTALKSLQESWLDTSNEGVAELLLGIFSWVAQEEKRKISERTKAGLARRRALGMKLGRPWCKKCGKSHKASKECKGPPLLLQRKEGTVLTDV